MIIPTPQDISEIIEKLRILKRKEIEFINRKFSKFSANKAAKNIVAEPVEPPQYGPSIEEIIKYAVYDVDNETDQDKELDDDSIALLLCSDIGNLCENIIPTLPVQKIEQLLNDFLPRIREGEISEEKEQNLQEIESSLRSELERNEMQFISERDRIASAVEIVKKAYLIRPKFMRYWPKRIQDLMREIDKLIFPYWDYLQENSSYKESGRSYIVYPILKGWIEMGIPSVLDRVIHEFEKVHHKLELESKQEPEQQEKDSQDEAKIIRKFVKALKETDQCERDSPEIEKAAKKAEKVLFDNWDLIKRFPQEYRLDHTLIRQFNRLEELVTKKDRGYILHWKQICDDLIKPTEKNISIVGGLEAWTDELEKETTRVAYTESVNKKLQAENVFKRTEDFWIVRYQGEDVGLLKHLDGMCYISELLANPHKNVPAVKLVRKVKKTSGERPITSVSHIELNKPDEPDVHSSERKVITPEEANSEIDRKYLNDCNKKIKELEADLERAKKDHDEAKEESLQNEIDAIRDALRSEFGPGGRFRQFADDPEKAKDLIKKSIARAKKNIKHKDLEEHFRAITIGRTCSYKPDREMNWQL